ncbi:ATP-dependent Clp protease proteolytic subunit [Musa troglodytarum]|uniref:ATP-dependent Clp protease proteolytic subunit n=1 Tax=Musa troglodytarum TaxID=320322 RepID=A0A9E7FMF8_9LILI|nr:ATP-dependent Clp protease proteolytic subunit [Musa troglodytarum]
MRQARPSLRVAAADRRMSLSEGWDMSVPHRGLFGCHDQHAPPAPHRLLGIPGCLHRSMEYGFAAILQLLRRIGVAHWVDTVTADLIISQLLFLDVEDQKKEIKLFINSPGGSVTAGMRIYDAMKLCKADVSTVCLGLVASMGAFLLAAWSKRKKILHAKC